MIATDGDRVRHKETMISYTVHQVSKDANEILLGAQEFPLAQWETGESVCFWDTAYLYEVWHDYWWRPITEIEQDGYI